MLPNTLIVPPMHQSDQQHSFRWLQAKPQLHLVLTQMRGQPLNPTTAAPGSATGLS